MRASVLVDVGRFELRDIPTPEPGPRDVMIDVSAVGLCGTDFHIFSGESNYNLDAHDDPIPLSVEPQVLGHEFTGVVTEVGRDVTDLAVDDRVVVDQGLNCVSREREPLCEYCRDGDSHQCESYIEYGITGLPGAFSEHLAVPALAAVRIESDVDSAEASMTEPLACILHSSATVARAPSRYSIGSAEADRRVRTILILGAGPAGLLFLQYLRNVVEFDGRIIVSEVEAKKRALAGRFGADVIDPAATDLIETVLEVTDGRRAEYVIEATGSGPVFAQIPNLIRKQATVLKYGIGHGGVSLEEMNRVHWKEPTFLMPVGASSPFDPDGRPTNYRLALDYIERGRIDVASLVTHRYRGLEDVPRAFGGDHASAEYVKGVTLLGDEE